MDKILPINDEPYIRTYTHHGFLHAIISSKDKVEQDENQAVVSVHVKDFGASDWKIQNDNLKYQIHENDRIHFYANRWNLGMNAAFWRECNPVDEIELTIHQQYYSGPWASINVFITDENQTDMIDRFRYCVQLGNYSKNGIYIMSKWIKPVEELSPNIANEDVSYYIPQLPLHLKLSKVDCKVYMEYTDNAGFHDKFIVAQEEQNITLGRIGFEICLGNNSYYEWTFANYVQLHYSEEVLPLDYMVNVQKNWKVYSCDYFFDYMKLTEKEITSEGLSTLDFIKKQINLNRYVLMNINDNIHFGITDKNGAYFHENLIYGYSDSDEILYTLSVSYGKIKATTLTYSEYESERNQKSGRFLYLLNYNPAYEGCPLSKNHLLQLYKEYRDGINISNYEPRKEQDMFGIHCIEYLTSQEGLKKLMNDSRISYLLLEHTKCNIDRLQYIFHKSFINEDQCNQMTQILENESHSLEIILKLALKVKYGGTAIEKDIQENIEDVYHYEREFITLIIKALSY